MFLVSRVARGRERGVSLRSALDDALLLQPLAIAQEARLRRKVVIPILPDVPGVLLRARCGRRRGCSGPRREGGGFVIYPPLGLGAGEFALAIHIALVPSRHPLHFVVIQLLALVVLASFPELTTWLPRLIFGT